MKAALIVLQYYFVSAFLSTYIFLGLISIVWRSRDERSNRYQDMKHSVVELASAYRFVVEKEESFQGAPPDWPRQLFHYEIASFYIPVDSSGEHKFGKSLFEDVYVDFRQFVDSRDSCQSTLANII